jgi:prevent-host-death family protein
MQSSDVVGAYEAKTKFSELLERVENGEEITVTRHGTPVARLVPVRQKLTREERAQLIEDMINDSRGRSLGGLKIRDLIAEGRR